MTTYAGPFTAEDFAYAPARTVYPDYDLPSGTLEELAESHSWACESYGETYAQYRSEVVHYGDAWPGAAHEVSAAAEGEHRLGLACDLHPDRLNGQRTFVPYYYNHLEHTPLLSRLSFRYEPF
jgi:hypothetical protein